MKRKQQRRLVEISSFLPAEAFYDICESWAEEPSAEAWDAQFAAIRAWVVRPN